ncbi:MAG: alanine--tRNA ligase [Candidatus Micrarchaeota archaeon]
MNKEELRKSFSIDFKKNYEVDLFRNEGFTRKNCSVCGKSFWSIGSEANCGDSFHTNYSFFKEKPLKETYASFWKKTKSFWEKHHDVIPRYPVLSRWRDDLHYTIASIVDFMRLENGSVSFDFPSPRLIVPQLCLRFVDIANVGVTGRHLSSFMMMGQHSFGAKGYWKNECLQYNFDYLTKVLKVPKDEVTYTEDVWSMPDYSAYGPCIESFSHGSELVNSVFMQYHQEHGVQKNLPERVIDVGWGFERLLWHYNGNSSIYDAVMPSEVDFVSKGFDRDTDLLRKYSVISASLDVDSVHDLKQEREKIASSLGLSLSELDEKIAPMQAAWAIADHSRTLLIAITDGAIPSNSAGGYNLRVLARRLFGFKSEYGFDFDLMKLFELHARDLKDVFPEFNESLSALNEIISVEERKYSETLSRAEKLALSMINSGVTEEKLIKAYESNGVTPEILERIAKKNKKQVAVPTGFYKKLTERDLMEKKTRESFSEEYSTKLDYYGNQNVFEGKAKVVSVCKDYVVLDKTLFYPEGGGQCADLGFINGVRVVDVKKQNNAVLHFVEKNEFKKGQVVSIKLDVARRKAIQMHHSATHVLISACRKVLGNHVWQCGAKKDEDEAHLDITHFRKVSIQEKNDIESLANEAVRACLPISCEVVDRKDAEKEHGFRLYQGGGAVAKKIRVLSVKDWDVEACGGLHTSNTGEIGLIKITSIEYIQDGVVRLRFKAGSKAIEFVQWQEKLLFDASSELSVQPEHLPKSVKRFFDEWSIQKRQVEKLRVVYVEELALNLVKQHPEKIVKQKVSEDAKFVEALALRISREPGFAAVIINEEGFVAAAVNDSSSYSAVDLLLSAGAHGGGSKQIARGKLE